MEEKSASCREVYTGIFCFAVNFDVDAFGSALQFKPVDRTSQIPVPFGGRCSRPRHFGGKMFYVASLKTKVAVVSFNDAVKGSVHFDLRVELTFDAETDFP